MWRHKWNYELIVKEFLESFVLRCDKGLAIEMKEGLLCISASLCQSPLRQCFFLTWGINSFVYAIHMNVKCGTGLHLVNVFFNNNIIHITYAQYKLIGLPKVERMNEVLQRKTSFKKSYVDITYPAENADDSLQIAAVIYVCYVMWKLCWYDMFFFVPHYIQG